MNSLSLSQVLHPIPEGSTSEFDLVSLSISELWSEISERAPGDSWLEAGSSPRELFGSVGALASQPSSATEGNIDVPLKLADNTNLHSWPTLV